LSGNSDKPGNVMEPEICREFYEKAGKIADNLEILESGVFQRKLSS